jgi:undecaprenyl-diphosphatase
MNALMKSITHLGSLSFAVALPLSLILFGSAELKPLGFNIALVLSASQAIVHILKRIVQRPRPFTALNWAKAINHPRDFSFPSGHTAAAFALALVIAKSIPQLALPGLILACLVAVSRVYLGVHYPSDCLVGFLITRFTILLLLGF